MSERRIAGHIDTRAGSTVWLTPPELLGKLGGFDLDPCAHSPRPWPTAAEHIAPPEDGLSADWYGRVWCNPPYGRDTGLWLEKLAEHGTGLALTLARTDTRWFIDHVWSRASAVLFLKGRLTFHRPDGSRAASNCGSPSCLIAYGRSEAATLEHCDLDGTAVHLRRATAALTRRVTAHTDTCASGVVEHPVVTSVRGPVRFGASS